VHAHVGDHGHYCVPIVFHDRALGVINMYTGAGHKRNVVEEEFLTTIAETLATLIERRRAEKALRKSIEGLERALEGAVHSLASTAGRRDPYTQSHQERVAELACAIAEEMGLAEERIDGLRVAATLHDVGKITVPSEILAKPGALTDIEFGIIKGHAQAGSDVVEGIPFPWPVALIILQHHERLNGTGYPNGTRGEDLLLEARILAVADVVEAMASHRPYRPALGVDRALEEIAMDAGALYDAEAVDACVRLLSSGAFDMG
jgi:putative nucleotidyltransferase with HDIG domain